MRRWNSILLLPATSAPSDSGGTAVSLCTTAQLQFTLGGVKGAAGNELAIVSLTNRASTCYLDGMPGWSCSMPLSITCKMPSALSTRCLARIRRRIGSTSRARHDLIRPELGWDRSVRTSFRITPPGDYDSTTISANGAIVCPWTSSEFPVGSPGKADDARPQLCG